MIQSFSIKFGLICLIDCLLKIHKYLDTLPSIEQSDLHQSVIFITTPSLIPFLKINLRSNPGQCFAVRIKGYLLGEKNFFQ